MKNKETNSNVLLESEGRGKRIIGIVAIMGGIFFILFLILLSLSFGGDSKHIETDDKNDLALLHANANEANNERLFEQDNFTEIESSCNGLLNDLGLDQNKQNGDLLDSVKNNEVFEPQPTFNESFSVQTHKEQQPWWLTKDGFIKPRIIKDASVGVISPRGGKAAKESNEQQKQ